MRVYKKLNISSLDELRQRIDNGEIEKLFGNRMAQHIQQGLAETHAMLLYRADDLSELIEEFLLNACQVRRAEAAGDYRRRVEVIDELVFVIETDNFSSVVERMQRYGGRTPLAEVGADHASFALSCRILLTRSCPASLVRTPQYFPQSDPRTSPSVLSYFPTSVLNEWARLVASADHSSPNDLGTSRIKSLAKAVSFSTRNDVLPFGLGPVHCARDKINGKA
jgi:hypothetical protein